MEKTLLQQYQELTNINDHTGAAKVLVDALGTEDEKHTMQWLSDCNDGRSLTYHEQTMRDEIGNKYYYQLKSRS